jgi:hypothetical protein
MKALLLAPCLALFIGLTGCTKKNYYTNPGVTFQATAAATDWTVDNADKSYVLSINTPELTSYAADNYAVVVSISYPDATTGQSTGQYETIPEVYQNISYSYTYNAGNISIYAQGADGTLPSASPGALTVKVAIIPSTAEPS